MGIGARIKKYLDEKGIKQAFVAEKAGITPSQMSDICNERVKSIDCVVYFRICKALGVPLETFVDMEEV